MFRLFIARDIADALVYLHHTVAYLNIDFSKAVIHGDVSPANVLITKDGRAKLCDLGCSREKNLASSTQVYRPGRKDRIFAAPELIERSILTHKSDIYRYFPAQSSNTRGDPYRYKFLC